MDNKKEVKKFNKRLLIVFLMMLAIFTTLLIEKSKVMAVSAEIQSLKQTDRGNPTVLTYNDLVSFYDILCCQHGAPLNGAGSSGGENHSVGEIIAGPAINSTYGTETYNTGATYSIKENHVCTPKEAYILSEMKTIYGLGSRSSAEIIYENGVAKQYSGAPLDDSVLITLSTGEKAWTVNEVYVIDTGNGLYYGERAKDSEGNVFYKYKTDYAGNLQSYNGKTPLTYKDPITGEEKSCTGVSLNIYKQDNLSTIDGTYEVYLVDYDTVVMDPNGVPVYAHIGDEYNDVQIAWWTTKAGGEGSAVAPNALSAEADAFENYILTITNKSDVSELTYEAQKYSFIEPDGTLSEGEVNAPVIEYNPSYNEDADQNGTINEADEITVAFDNNEQVYTVGPFSLNYVKESASIKGRDKVIFAGISGVTLKTNLGDLMLHKDWEFKYLTDQGRDVNDDYIYPNPNEVFYIDIKTIDGLTAIEEFKFYFEYMNAGGEVDIYDGTFNTITLTGKRENYYKDDGSFDYYVGWQECTSCVSNDSQTLAHGLKAARWYKHSECTKEFGQLPATITIEKTTYNEEGTEKIPVNKDFHFKIYINEEEFQELTVSTKNGYGKTTSNKIVWGKDESAPTYRIEEIGDVENNGPWTGTVTANTNISIDAKNYIKPQTGKLQLDKKLLNPTPALESEEFKFNITVTGTFGYDGGEITTYKDSNPLKLITDIEGFDSFVKITGANSYISEEFRWYGAAPKYKIEEIIPDNADYELVNGVISNGKGALKANETVIATATNQPTTDWTIIEVDKKMVSETTPQPGEVFTAELTIKGNFSYKGENYDDEHPFKETITLNESNNWIWTSDKIVWKKGQIPTYTISEVEEQMPEGTSFFSISDEVITSYVNEFESKLNPEKTNVIITNEREKVLKGRIQINKELETSDINGLDFYFKVEVQGTFKFNGEQYTNDKIPFVSNDANYVKIHVDDMTGTWKSDIITWKEGDEAPTYKVTEIIPEEAKYEFVSIANEEKVVTSSKTIDGKLIGVDGSSTDTNVEEKVGKVVVTCINRGNPIPTDGRIVIVKESNDETIDGWPFYFKVTISGKFKYYKINSDGSEDPNPLVFDSDNQKESETLILNGKQDGVVAYCGGEDWVSGRIEWDKDSKNPTYTVEEIDKPANVKFVSIANRSKISETPETPVIDGVIEEGTENNYVTAINTSDGDFSASLEIYKKFDTSDIKGKIYLFDLKLEGDFTYGGKEYSSESKEYFELKDIEIEAGGLPFVLGEVDFKGDKAPRYTVQEVGAIDENGGRRELKNDEFVSISNEKFMYSVEDGKVKTSGILEKGCEEIPKGIQGYLNSDMTKTIKIDAINKGEKTTGSHIEITKEVLNSKLKGTNFYFNVQVTSKSPFKYHDLEDYSKVTEYNVDEETGIASVSFENVIAVADERDWVSGYFEWDEGPEVEPPTYTISENIKLLPENVKAISIKNDTEIYYPDTPLTNKSSDEEIEKFKVEGKLVGDVTHIIAVNDSDTTEEKYIGKVSIEKKAISPLIVGEEFTFTLTLTGNFTYDGTKYTKLEIPKITIKADDPNIPNDSDDSVWSSGIIEWDEDVKAPTYTVTEDSATFNDGTKIVSIRNAYQTNYKQNTISGTVEGVKVPKNAEYTELETQGIIPDNWIIAENDFDGVNKGKIQIHKVLVDGHGNEINGVDFHFKITIQYYDSDGNPTTTQNDFLTVVSGGNARTNWYYWSKKDKNPTFHIEEVEASEYECTINPADGTLVAQDPESEDAEVKSGIKLVNAQNKQENPCKAQIRVNKKLILNDKISEDDVTVSFPVLVKISGKFTYKEKAYNDETLTLKFILSKDSDWTALSDIVYWKETDEAPTFTVEEPEAEIPVGWHLVSTKISPEDNKLVDGEIAVADITNEWTYDEELILTMKLGGKVWDDTNRTLDKHVDAIENGIIDEGEPGIANIKVKIYRALVAKDTGNVLGRLNGVYVYDENNLMVLAEDETYTDENGNWSFGAVAVPSFTQAEKDSGEYGRYIDELKFESDYVVTYDVEFEYDGQTYEPTDFLATAGGEGASSYKGASSTNNMYSYIVNRWETIIDSSTSERDNFLKDSMAIDNADERKEFNRTFAGIQGKEPMDDEGNTLGTTNSEKELHYTSVDSVSFFDSDNSRKVSSLRTLNDDNEIYEELRFSNATSNANLTFPFYTEDPRYDTTAWHLKGWDKTITDLFRITYKYEAIYNYCLSINLGLVEREAADLAVEKDLTEALVVVNGKALKYKFNTAIDLEDSDYSDLLYKQLAVEDSNIEYKLGLYKGDYYYRAEVYNTDTDVKDALEGFYTRTLGLPSLEYSEMEVYLKYTINVYNESETYDVVVGEIADYYDSSFKLISDTESRYVQNLNGKDIDRVVEVASPSKVQVGDSEDRVISVTWYERGTVGGSDGVNYNKITTSSLADTKLASGEKASFTVTFKVDKDNISESGIRDAIKLGKKHNVAEVTKFTSYYSDSSENRWSNPGDISGRVDEDSAPDNVNIKEYNDKAYYEDDTESAPIITIGFKDGEERTVSGIVWDDAQTKDIGLGQKVGNGIYNPEEGDKLISELTTEIFESISIPIGESDETGEKVYAEYQFAWPTDRSMEVLGNKSIYNLTGFNQATTTNKYGEYSFVGLPAGNYKVRYVYGDKKIETGKKGSEEIYSGQDYKTTAYQIGFDNDRNDDGYVDNQWHDISNNKLSDLRVNDARDDEARRLYISAKSEMLTYDNTSLLSKADNKSLDLAEYQDLFGNYLDASGKPNPEVRDNAVNGEGYYMYAETAKINLGVENIYKVKYNTIDLGDIELGEVEGNSKAKGADVGTSSFKYNIKNVDCGLEERSQTKITLDKQIKQITLMTSDNKIILDAVYDIDYSLKQNGSIASTVTLNESASTGIDHIASLNRNGSNQGYRYIIADSQILQGTQIQVKYQLTLFNMSETDRISKDLDTLWSIMNKAETEELKQDTLKSALDAISTNKYTETRGRVYKTNVDGTNRYVDIGYGRLFGSVYYLGSQGVGVRPDETIVKTKVHQMIDYVDPDVEFTDMNNISRDQSWSNTDIDYLLRNKLIDPSIVQILDSEGRVTGDTYATRQTLNSGERWSIISDKLQEYSIDSKNNLILTIDNGEALDTGSNPGFVKFLEPYMANNNIDRATGVIALTVSRFYSSETDANDIDNLAEIIKVENTAGRRDSRNIAGNANPYKLDSEGNPIGIYATAQGREKDASATEVITLSPPTGLNANESRTMQLILVVLISVTLVAVAIVIIKKKVLIKN